MDRWWGRAKWLGWIACDRAMRVVRGIVTGARKMLGLNILIPIAAAVVAAGWVWVSKEVRIAQVRGEEQAACAVKIANVRDEINAIADLRVAAAEAAALEVNDPQTDAELEAICKADRYCRDREGK